VTAIVLGSLFDFIDDRTGLGRAVALILVVFGLFAIAWLIGRIAERIATILVDRAEKRRAATDPEGASVSSLRQRETAISLVSTSVRYVVFVVAAVLSLIALSGAEKVQTIVGASFLALIIGFAAQRFLADVVAGLLMFFEGWFRIGDTVSIDPWNARGVIEAVSLRSITIRTIQGEIVYVPNSQVIALRRYPHGYHQVEVEFFASDLVRGKELVDEIAELVPVGSTRFLSRPEIAETEALGDDLARITVHCAIAVGREWLVEDFLTSLIKERAGEGLLVHGPIVTFIDEQAVRSYARATRTPSKQALSRSGSGKSRTPPD
jgi:moderate conductance mechanosensitive channel